MTNAQHSSASSSKPVVPTTVPVVVSSSVSGKPTAPIYTNGTTPTVPVVTSPVGTGSATKTSAVATFTGAANQAFVASGAGLAAVFGLAAYIL